MADDLKQLLETIRQENAAAHAETRRHPDEVAAETRRHFDAADARWEARFDALAKHLAAIDEKLDRKTAALEERMNHGFAETQSMIKFSHHDLDRRLRSLEEVVADLEARIERLESSTH